jgi:hypothetical protein
MKVSGTRSIEAKQRQTGISLEAACEKLGI